MIDKAKLQELLAADPKAKPEAIWKGLGFENPAIFRYHLKRDPEAHGIFKAARAAARVARGTSPASKRGLSKTSAQKKAKRSTPPAMAMPKAA